MLHSPAVGKVVSRTVALERPSNMRTTDVADLARDLQTVLGLVAAGEEIEVTRDDRVVARLVPPAESAPRIAWPDFSARARKIVRRAKGTLPSQLIVADRGERM